MSPYRVPSRNVQNLRKWLADESLDKNQRAHDFTDWTYLRCDCPQQNNGYDCGYNHALTILVPERMLLTDWLASSSPLAASLERVL